MKKDYLQIIVFIFLVISLMIITFGSNQLLMILKTRAAGDQLIIKLKLQGDYQKITKPTFTTKLDIYTTAGLVKQFDNLTLTKIATDSFTLTVELGSWFKSVEKYAMFIKPDKFLGRLFCSQTLNGASCTVPQIVLTSIAGSNIYNLDLSSPIFYSGDIYPQDGKVTAEDLSKILADIGKVDQNYLATDINGDKKTEAVDYLLVLYSLSNNIADDKITLNFTPITPSATGITITNTPTSTSLPEITPSTTPTITTLLTPTTTSTAAGGTCKATINGKIYVNVTIGGVPTEMCSLLTNEKIDKCVTSANQCTTTACIDEVIAASKLGVTKCASSYNGSLNEAKSREALSCQVSFVPGTCVPTPTPTISCEPGPSC